MSLVPDYDSDASDSEAEAIISVPDPKPTITVKSNATKKRKRVITVDLPDTSSLSEKQEDAPLPETDATKKPKVSISSFLPPPKNRKAPKTAPKVEPIQTKQQQQLPTQIPDTTKSNTDSTTPIPSLFSFDTSKSIKPTSISTVPSYGPSQPANLPSVPSHAETIPQIIPQTITHTQLPLPHPKKKRRGEPDIDPSAIIDFNVDEFYKSNLDARGGAANMATSQINRPVKTVASGKHQLSSLVKSARENQDGLEEMFSNNRKTKKEIGSKYGF